MSKINLDPPLIPKNGNVLQVLAIDRISTKNQDPKSNADQQALLRNYVIDRYDGPMEWIVITGQGSGELLDREQVREAEDRVSSGRIDLVMLEDVGRHVRRAQAVLFCEQCEDYDTRLIAINDSIDTAKDWRLHAFFAAIKHEQSNKDTSDRIKRTLRNRFLQGEVVQFTIYGYVKPKGAKSDAELFKDPAAEAIYDEWFRMLENGAGYSEVMDWLNEMGIPTGSYCRNDKWDCAMVARVTRNPILKGVRERNNRKSKRINKSGNRVSVKAKPAEKLERFCPHLAFIDPVRFDRLMRVLAARNAKYKRGQKGSDPLVGRPKKRTIWPGQHVICGRCGRLYRYGGHGQNNHLMCRGATEYSCWSGTTVDGPLAASKMAAAILDAIESLPGFDPVFESLVAEELAKSNGSRNDRLEAVRLKEAKATRELSALIEFVKEGKRSASLHDEIELLEAQRDRLMLQREAIEAEPTNASTLPPMEEIKQLARAAMSLQAKEPYEFGRIMRELIPQIVVWTYRLCDNGPIELRAKFTLSLASLLPPAQRLTEVERLLQKDLVVDLFDPPQREAYRKQVMALKGQGWTQPKIAKYFGITITAVQRAAALQRKMDELGIDDPYVLVTAPPADLTKMRRHKHPRYRFDPLPGFGDT